MELQYRSFSPSIDSGLDSGLLGCLLRPGLSQLLSVPYILPRVIGKALFPPTKCFIYSTVHRERLIIIFISLHLFACITRILRVATSSSSLPFSMRSGFHIVSRHYLIRPLWALAAPLSSGFWRVLVGFKQPVGTFQSRMVHQLETHCSRTAVAPVFFGAPAVF